MTAAAEKLAPKGTPKTTPNAARAAAGLPPYGEPPKHPNLAAALAAFQAEVPNVRKGQTANVASQKGSYSYDYADLSDVTEATLPLLGKHGLAFSAMPTQDERGFLLEYALTHESGDRLAGKYPLPAAATPPQQLGSAITYARRYILTAITGVAPGGDDDDAQATQAYQNQPQQAPRLQAPAQAAPEPRNWAAKAEQDYAAGAPASHLAGLWQAAKQDGAPLEHLDRIASLGRARQAESEPTDAEPEPTDAEPAAEETPEDAPAGEKAHA